MTIAIMASESMILNLSLLLLIMSYVLINCDVLSHAAVVIGFKNSLEAVVEGGTKSVCAEVKPEGLRLDPFDSVSLTVRINPGLYII